MYLQLILILTLIVIKVVLIHSVFLILVMMSMIIDNCKANITQYKYKHCWSGSKNRNCQRGFWLIDSNLIGLSWTIWELIKWNAFTFDRFSKYSVYYSFYSCNTRYKGRGDESFVSLAIATLLYFSTIKDDVIVTKRPVGFYCTLVFF